MYARCTYLGAVRDELHEGGVLLTEALLLFLLHAVGLVGLHGRALRELAKTRRTIICADTISIYNIY